MFDSLNFTKLFKDFSRQKVLVIGDVMIDTYLWGKVSRVSPEAPVPIVSSIMEESRLGGAANVALNIKAMGAVPILCSVIGGDERGSVFLDLMEEQNLSDVGLIVDDYRLTTQKTRVISGNQHLLRVDEEMDTFLSSRVEKQFIELIQNLLESGGIDSIILQDYDKGILTPKLIREVGNIAGRQSIPVLVDPKYRNFHEYKNLSLFKPNFNELVQGLNVDFKKGDVMKLADACMQFQEENKLEIMMVTLSEHGILTTSNGDIIHLPAVVRDVTDVSGAGDTVISLAALCLSAGLTSGEVAAISNLAGGQVCEKSGVVPVNYEQLLKECKESFVKK